MSDMRIGAIIVSYNPNISRLEKSVNSISMQVDFVIIIDNGSKNIAEVSSLFIDNSCELIIYEQNLGISKALNQGFKKLIDLSCNWIVTLDQDTICPEGMVESFGKYMMGDVGIVCPAVHYKGINYMATSTLLCEEIEACMTSACLVNVDAWKKVEGFNEDYFIDFVDNEFCMKLRLAGFRIIRDWSKYIEHELGTIKEYRIGNRVIKKTVHSPVRYYYMTRNNLFFIRQYKKKINSIKEYIRLLYVIGRELPYTDNKVKSLKYVIKGVRDYRIRKVGALEE